MAVVAQVKQSRLDTRVRANTADPRPGRHETDRIGGGGVELNRRLPASAQSDSYWGGEAVDDEAYRHDNHDGLLDQGILLDFTLFDH